MNVIQEDIVQLRLNLEVAIDNALNIVQLNNNVLGIANQTLTDTSKQLESLKIGGGLQQSIKQRAAMLTNLSKNEQIQQQKSVILEQVLVLFIGALEVYLNELIRVIANKEPELFTFKDPNEKINFTQDMFKSGFTLGDAFLEHLSIKGKSFQSLKSAQSVLSDYLGVDVPLTDELRDDLILCAAFRNCIVHNMSMTDIAFIRQIKKTRYSRDYSEGATLKITENIVEGSKKAILEYTDLITAAFTQGEEDD